MKYLDETIENLAQAEERTSVMNRIFMLHKKSRVRYWFSGIGIAVLLFMFLPWTQNIRGKGKVTTLFQEQRPQELNSVLPGRILKWYVKEGDIVSPGDTILELSEVKAEYLDPNILSRTAEQISAKKLSAENYSQKAAAAQNQINALRETNRLKIEETNNKIRQQEYKVKSNRAAWVATQTDAKIANQQLQRNQELYNQGLISLTDLEAKQNKYQATQAKETEAQIKYENTKRDLSRMSIELVRVQQEYAEKIAKTQSDRFQSMSHIASTQGEVAKLQNQYNTYDERRKLYIVRAPQEGQITDARVSGIGEVIKEGEHIVTIVPEKLKYTVELFVKPIDVPLIQRGQKVAFLFDGFPAIVFSGWPGASYGIFKGEVLTIENNTNDKGYYRVLVIEDEESNKPWPKELRIGTGAKGIALLKDVPIWYELWRNINGFPPDYYTNSKKDKNEK
jgi:multidrug efflux pump subunit AcrA (membrane-fusion protein)